MNKKVKVMMKKNFPITQMTMENVNIVENLMFNKFKNIMEIFYQMKMVKDMFLTKMEIKFIYKLVKMGNCIIQTRRAIKFIQAKTQKLFYLLNKTM